MRTGLLLAVIALGLAGNPLLAAETTPRPPKTVQLTLDEFVTTAAQRDAVFQEILIDELQLQYQEVLALPAQDLVLAVQGQYNYSLCEGWEDGPEGGLALSKLFAASGTDLSAEYGLSRNTLINEYRSNFTFALSQPIAKNAFGRANRLKSQLIGIENDLARHQIAEAYEDYLAALVQTYYQWYAAFQLLETSRAIYRDNLQVLKNMQAKQKSKIADQTDVDKIRLQVLGNQEDIITFQQAFRELLHDIERSLRHAGTTELRPVEPASYKQAEQSFADDYARFTRGSRTYRILALLEKQGKKSAEIYADDLLPSANLRLGYQADGAEFAFDNKGSRVFAGASLEWPLPGQQQGARYETARINADKTRLTTGNTRLQLQTDLKNLHLRIEREKELLSITKEKIRRTEAILAEESRNYGYGRVTLNDLIAARSVRDNALYNKISHTIELYRLEMEWLRLTDQLITPREMPRYGEPGPAAP